MTTALTVVLATRRTWVHRSTIYVYRAMLVVTLAAITGELILRRDVTSLGALAGAILGLLIPVPRVLLVLTRRLPALALLPSPTQNLNTYFGYHEEALAFATFLAPQDIPRSLVIRVALAAKQGRVASLDSLTPQAFRESGPDALSLDPLTQRLAYHRLSRSQRKEWAGLAVRELATYFPADYASNPAWCERLAPHAMAAARHAYELETERGAAALLLNHVGGYFLLSDRSVEAAEALHLALACARTAFGEGSTQVATIRANLFGESFAELPFSRAKPKRTTKVPEHRLLAFGLSIVVVIAGGLVGGVLWHQAYLTRPQPASHPLVVVADLQELCGDPQRFFPDAPPVTDTGQHPVQLFFRESEAADYVSERLTGTVPEYWRATDTTVRQVQLVGCVTRVSTGAVIVSCSQAIGPQILVYQATYDVKVFEVRTGERTAATTIRVTTTVCPTFSQSSRVYARPALADYRRTIGGYVE
jgi:hypothetical protein